MFNQAANISQAAKYLFKGVRRDPRAADHILRRAGAALLDEKLDKESPIPFLPSEINSELSKFELTLPPMGTFELGNQSVVGLMYLTSLCKWIGSTAIFEIGTYNGLTAHTLASNLPDAQVVTLDLPADELPRLETFEGDELHFPSTQDRYYCSQSTSQRIEQLEGDSANFDFSSYYGRFDLVYVDGAHSYGYITSDTKHAQRLLKSRGAIVWDDYTRGMVGVRRALDELSTSLTLYRIPNTRLVVHLTPGLIR